MRRFVGAVVAASMLSGCTVLTREVRYPGGFTGHIMDQRTFNASQSKQAQLFRMALMIAIGTRMASLTIHDAEDAAAFRRYLASASKELNYTAANIYPADSKKPCRLADAATASAAEDCQGFLVNFEADMPLLESRVVRLIVAALPEQQARRFLASVQSGNLLGAAWDAFKLVSKTAGSLRRGAAVYRTGLEALAASGVCRTEGGYVEDAKEAKSTVLAATHCLGLPQDTFSAKDEIEPEAFQGRPMPGAIHAVMRIARTDCLRLPQSVDADSGSDLCNAIGFAPKGRMPSPPPPPGQPGAG